MSGNDEESSKTTAWTPARRQVDADESWNDLPRVERRSRRWIAAGVAGVGLGVVGLAVVLTRGDDSAAPGHSSDTNPTAANVGATSADPVQESWWDAPDGRRVSIEAHSLAFRTLDERNLGEVFDRNLAPVYGAPRLFEAHEPQRYPRGEMSRSLTSLRNTLQLKAGFSAVLASVGVTYSTERSYLLYRAFHVDTVLAVDESKRMKEPPEAAVFYLAEVHRGWSYDLLVEGEFEQVGAELEAFIKVGTASASMVESRFGAKVHQSGLGLRANKDGAIFAMTPEAVASAYTEMELAVPVRLIFRTIPGRRLKEEKVPRPTAVADEDFVLMDDEHREWLLPPGRYRVRATSDKNGIRLDFRPDSHATCAPALPREREYTRASTTCTVSREATLRMTNYHHLANGPVENGHVWILRLP